MEISKESKLQKQSGRSNTGKFVWIKNLILHAENHLTIVLKHSCCCEKNDLVAFTCKTYIHVKKNASTNPTAQIVFSGRQLNAHGQHDPYPPYLSAVPRKYFYLMSNVCEPLL